MPQDNNRDPQEQQISPQRSNPGQQQHEADEPVNKAPQPTEQNLHAEEVGQPGRVDHHLFRCDHGRTLLVDFENEGLTLSIRDKPAAPPLRLTAPAQGELFVGKGGSAAMKDQALQLEMADGTRRTCVRANKG